MIANAVNPALKALMVLQQDAQPLNPQGQPTVAAEMAAQAEQKMLGQPDLNQAAQQVGIAAPIQAQQQQQAQTDQITNAVMQKLQGVSSLAAPNMQFKEGGIIGYDGTAGSYVMSPEESGLPPQEGSSLFQAIADYLRGKGTVYEYDPSTEAGAAPKPSAEAPREDLRSRNMDAVRAAEARAAAQGKAPSGEAPVARPRPESGITSGVTSEAAKDLAALRKLTGREFSEKAPTIEGVIDEYQKARGLMGLSKDIGEATNKAISRADKRMEDMRAEYEEGKKNRGLETFIEAASAARYGGLGGLGKAYTKTQKEQRAADMNFRRLMDESERQRDQMMTAVEGMKEAAAANNTKDFNAYKKDWLEGKRHFDDVNTRIAGQVASISAQREEGALNRAAQSQRMALDKQAMNESRMQTLLNNINTEMGRKSEELRARLEKESPAKMLYQMKAIGAPLNDKQAAELMADKERIDNTVRGAIQPMIQQRNQILGKLGGIDFSQWGQLSVN